MTQPRSLPSITPAEMAGQTDSLATSSAAFIFAILALAITLGSLVGAVLFSGVPLRSDAGILLDCARLILRGWLPYVDYVETNPPMVHYVHVIPVYLASILGLEIHTAFYIFVLTFTVYAAVALIFLLSRLPPVFYLPSRLVLGSVCLLFSLWVLRAGEFGQKDHLFALAYVPWLYCRVIRHGRGDVPWAVGIAIGLMSGPLFLMKPHFCLIVALAECWLLFLSRRSSALWCPETLALAGWVLAYAVHFYFVPSEMREALFFRWLPFIIANYDVYDHPMSDIATQFSIKLWLLQIPVILAVLVLMAKSRLPNKWKLQLHALVASTLLAWGAFIAQHKGWPYHLLPVIVSVMLLAGTVVIMMLEWERGVAFLSKVRAAVRTGIFVLVCSGLSVISIAMVYSLFESAKVPDSTDDFVRLIEQHVAPDEKVAFISTSVSPAYPAMIYTKRLPGTRFLCAFPIVMLYKGVLPRADGTFPYRSPSEATSEEQGFLNELGNDILRHRPKLVFIDASDNCQACPKGFRIERYLADVGWLQRFMKNYRETILMHGYAVYVRVD
jgi:hypothetical protein